MSACYSPSPSRPQLRAASCAQTVPLCPRWASVKLAPVTVTAVSTAVHACRVHVQPQSTLSSTEPAQSAGVERWPVHVLCGWRARQRCAFSLQVPVSFSTRDPWVPVHLNTPGDSPRHHAPSRASAPSPGAVSEAQSEDWVLSMSGEDVRPPADSVYLPQHLTLKAVLPAALCTADASLHGHVTSCKCAPCHCRRARQKLKHLVSGPSLHTGNVVSPGSGLR